MLPSQAVRSATGRTAAIPSRRGPMKRDAIPARLLWLGIGAVAVIGTIVIWSRFTGPAPGAPPVEDLAAQRASTPPGGPGPGTVSDPLAAPAPASPREPVTIQMGAAPAANPAGDRHALVPPPIITRNQPASNAPAPGGSNPLVTPPGSAPSGPSGPGMHPTGPAELSPERDALDAAARAKNAGRMVEARTILNKALMNGSLSASQRATIRQQVAELQNDLVFGPQVSQGDPFADWYTVQPGDSLVRIMNRQSLPPDWRLIQRINRLARPGDLHAGQRLKVIRQPFHAIVHKNDYRMDVYIGEPLTPGTSNGRVVGPDGQEESWTYVRSFKVGLGESNGTPEGTFTVRPKSKLVNPRWVNPRTGEKFEADDPKNPIGEHWIGLDGADENTRRFAGYGIHGTVDLASIGQQRSMGCVRMLPDDVALVYELMSERLSSVKILP